MEYASLRHRMYCFIFVKFIETKNSYSGGHILKITRRMHIISMIAGDIALLYVTQYEKYSVWWY